MGYCICVMSHPIDEVLRNADRPAVPYNCGLTKREMFAMAAMQGILSNPMNLASADTSTLPSCRRNYLLIAVLSVDMADFLLARLERASAEQKLNAEIKACHDPACPCACHSNARL